MRLNLDVARHPPPIHSLFSVAATTLNRVGIRASMTRHITGLQISHTHRNKYPPSLPASIVTDTKYSTLLCRKPMGMFQTISPGPTHGRRRRRPLNTWSLT